MFKTFQFKSLLCQPYHMNIRGISYTCQDGLQRSNNSKCNLANLNNIWSLNLEFFSKYTSINMLKHEHRAHQYHAMLCYASCLSIAMGCLHCCCLGVCLFLIDSSPDVVF